MEKIIGIIIGIICVIKLSESANFIELLEQYGVRQNYGVPTKEKPTRTEYDYIVVGAGPGGATVTNRLSEDSNRKVLLLEAGKPDGLVDQIPFALAGLMLTEYNWGYRVEADGKSCLGMDDQRCTWPRGKSLGGTTTLYGMVHTRGNKLDFDKWAEMGNYGWDFKSVLPYFKKSEKFRIPGLLNPTYHNANGNVNVEYPQWRTPLATAFLEAGQKIGYNVTDYNGENQLGFGYIQVHMDKGARCNAARAHLRVKRSNLDIVTRARVLRVLINSDRRAYGVEYEKDGKRYEVYASKEVVLSAGAIDSPKLLMLSGVGPKEHLEKLGIPVVKDAKVGYNLQEHIGFWGLTYQVNLPQTLLLKNLLNPKVFLDYILRREGPLSSGAGIESIGFLRTKYAKDERPDVEILYFSAAPNSDNGFMLRRAYGISDRIYDAVFKPFEGKDTVLLWPVVQFPNSRGRILLKSKSPYDDPILRGNFFDDPMDLEIILEGIKYGVELMKTEPFKKYGAKINDLKVPGCEQYEFGSDDYWRCAVLVIPGMENHECGTVKMGPKSDPDAVVDPELRVYGVNGLRVIDASIFTSIPTGHISASIYMVGEKGADMIKQTWKGKP